MVSIKFSAKQTLLSCNGPLTGDVKLRDADGPGMAGKFPLHRLQMKQLVSYLGMHHCTCVTHVPWCMSGYLTRGCRENVPGIPGACATRHFTYLARGPYQGARMRTQACELRLSQLLCWHGRIGKWYKTSASLARLKNSTKILLEYCIIAIKLQQ